MDKIYKKYNVIGSDFFYHHTISEPCGNVYFFGPESHRQYEVLYLIDGEISYIIEGETYTATKGDFIFVYPKEIHTLKINGDLAYERAVVLFDMNIIERLTDDIDARLSGILSTNGRRLRIIDGESARAYGLDETIRSIIDCAEDEPYKKLTVVSHLIKFIIEIDKFAKSGLPPLILPDSVDPLIRKISDYVDRHISEKISLDDIANELFVSKSTVSHRFSGAMNMPLNRYITLKKMHLAGELMKSGLNASEVCREIGYDNYTTFYYNYKKIMGKAPSTKVK